MAEELRLERAYGNGIRAYTAAKNSGMESGYGSIGARKKQSVFYNACREKNEILYCGKNPDRKGETMAKTIISVLSEFPKEAVKTITCDRDSEFSC